MNQYCINKMLTIFREKKGRYRVYHQTMRSIQHHPTCPKMQVVQTSKATKDLTSQEKNTQYLYKINKVLVSCSEIVFKVLFGQVYCML